MSGKRVLYLIMIGILLMIALPYVVGFQAGNSQEQFGGFLINPIDGHSYLAKMRQGYRGEWKFTLPFTEQAGNGAYLFLFYHALGHIGRVVGAPLIWVFHAARLIGAILLILMIDKTIRELFQDQKAVVIGLILAGVGSGLGWLAVFWGSFTSDFWVAEAYPFLSMYTNPHFSLGLGIMIYSVLPKRDEQWASGLLAGILLGIVQPFGVVIICAVKWIYLGWKYIKEKAGIKEWIRSREVISAFVFTLAGGAVILYQFWEILQDPVLSKWHQQNITPNPGLLDVVISLSPCLILAAVGARKALENDTGRKLVLWGLVSMILIFVPWGLQRRFLTGIFFPLAVVSISGLFVLDARTPIKFSYWAIFTLFLSIITNLIVIASGIQAISTKEKQIFIDNDFLSALSWLEDNAEEDDLILADKRDGLFIPSLIGRRVIYGHPFETIDAEREQQLVEGFFYIDQSDAFYEDVIENRGVDFVIARESNNDSVLNWLGDNLSLEYRIGAVRVFTGHNR